MNIVRVYKDIAGSGWTGWSFTPPENRDYRIVSVEVLADYNGTYDQEGLRVVRVQKRDYTSPISYDKTLQYFIGNTKRDSGHPGHNDNDLYTRATRQVDATSWAHAMWRPHRDVVIARRKLTPLRDTLRFDTVSWNVASEFVTFNVLQNFGAGSYIYIELEELATRDSIRDHNGSAWIQGDQ